MPPLAPPAEQKSGPRHRQGEKAGEAVVQRKALARRSASFHGRGAAEHQHQQRHPLLRQRPRTQPDLLAGVRGQHRADADVALPWASGRKTAPSKVLVTVAVQESMWPLHIMARTEWRVAELVAAAVELYVKEGRRPLLPSVDASAFSLHYSKFSLQRLDPEEKLMELGSRSFFLCFCFKAAPPADASSTCSSAAETDKATATTAIRLNPNMPVPWLRLMHFWPLL